MNAFEIAATALLCGYLPLGYVAMTRRAIDGVVALELGGTLAMLVILCFAQGFHRPFEDGVAVVAGLLSWVGGLVFVRFLGRWL
jgi:multisubunit Na+/H+ antiporter MnhF subunit